MYLKEKYEENNQLNNSTIDSIIFIRTIKIIIILNLIFQSLPFPNNQIKVISQKGTSLDTKDKITHAITKTITNKEKSLINNYLSSIPEKYSREKQYEKESLEKYFNLIDLPDNATINSELKNQILEKLII